MTDDRTADPLTLYRVLVNAAPDAVLAIDVESRILLANPAAEAMFGHPVDELVGTLLVRLMPERLRAMHERGISRYLDSGVRKLDWRATHAIGIRASGDEFPITISFAEAELEGRRAFLGFIRDISAEVEATAALREAQRLHEGLLASVGQGIVGLDAQGLIVFANPTAEQILGMSRHVLIGCSFHQAAHTASDGTTACSSLECALARALESGHALHLSEDTFVCGDATRVPVEVITTPLCDADVVTGAVIAFRDISARQALEEQLRQTHKMDAVGQLAGGIAHDFNNLLTVILAHTSFLLESVPAGALHDDASSIRRAAERAAALTSQLLAYSRRQMLVATPVSLVAVVAGLEPMLRRLIGEHIAFVTQSHAREDVVLADRGQLEQVITNLVLNARDAMPRGGTLSIEIDSAPAMAGATPDHARVVLRVADTGVGMDAVTRARAFEPFFTTKPTGKGTGLGLATAFGIVSQSGGSMSIDSATQQGTTVSVFLPRAAATDPDRSDALRTRPEDPPAVSSTPTTILVVEDEGAVRAACTRILKRSGYHVLEARHGADAVLVAREYTGDIALLLTDVVMPEVNGIELAKWFATAYPESSVVFMSGYTDDELFRQGLTDGHLAFVAKPFSADELVGAVREAVAERRG